MCDLVLTTEPTKSKFIPPRRKKWMLNYDNTHQVFEQSVDSLCQNLPEGVENAWSHIKDGLLKATDETCGWTKGGIQCHKETWWWSEDVNQVIIKRKKSMERWLQRR